MKILGFGENKDDSPHKRKDERERKDERVDTTYVNNIEEEPKNIEDVEEDDDYIDPDDLDYSEYEDIVDGIEYNGWTDISSAGVHPITHFDTNIVIINPVKKDTQGNVLEIICPKDIIIAICGFHQCEIDEDSFYQTPNLYIRPHFITIRCADDANREISPNTIISILMVDKKGQTEKLYQEFYGDLSPTANGDTSEELKRKQERYYFAETVVLQKGEKLVFHVHNPDKDVSKIELLMMSDLFRKDEE